MKYYYIAICVLILLLASCVPKEPESKLKEEQIKEPTQEPELCTAIWICTADNAKAYRKSDCTFEQVTSCPDGCENGECKEEPIEEQGEEIEEQMKLEEEKQPKQESIELSEEEQIQQTLSYAKTKINSYSYKYKGPTGKQYNIYAKGDKIRVGTISEDYTIYLDTIKKTAEKWCISHTKCGKETGKIADLDYYDAYIETPIDWLGKIKEAKKIDKGFYYGKQSWKLDTNIGTVIIDSNFGFIYSIEQKDKKYLFTEASFNTVKDSDVNVPEYLIKE